MGFNELGSKISWNSKLNILAIGFVNGLIKCYRVSEYDHNDHQEYCETHLHLKEITGIQLSSNKGNMYAISADKNISCTELTTLKTKSYEKDFLNVPCCLLMDHKQTKLIVADA